MRIGGGVAVVAALFVLACIGARAQAANGHASASCARGAKAAVIAGNFKCLKVGASCSAAHQSDYRRYGFVCQSKKLRKKTPTGAGSSGSGGATTPAPTPTPPAVPPGSDRAHPIALGQPGDIGNGWTVTITGVSFDAWSALAAANMFNSPPAAGLQDVMISVSATYSGAGSAHLDPDFIFRSVGASNVSYTAFGNDCGVLPDPDLKLQDPEVFTGGTVSGNAACWQVAIGDVSSLEMFTEPFLSQTQVWFALR